MKKSLYEHTIITQHEKNVLEVKNLEQQLECAKDKLIISPTNLEIALWELTDELTAMLGKNAYIYYGMYSVSINLNRKISLEELEELYETIDDTLVGYKLDDKNSTDKRLEYVNGKYEDITIYIRSSTCKRIPTGKLIPETKEDCSFVEV